ncbi:hypothetical protein PROFUN_05226 [Planoprotostelium fungivorum]|uniref:Uncharacterized protein n=1 Tax=Planoprotostelium fungivorum TaxID=1890364 RepID=A0A2P6NRT0_9EUKA|nr:hypothetical protein PROFUN_05226 [Planoprotostelium fungivorum]
MTASLEKVEFAFQESVWRLSRQSRFSGHNRNHTYKDDLPIMPPATCDFSKWQRPMMKSKKKDIEMFRHVTQQQPQVRDNSASRDRRLSGPQRAIHLKFRRKGKTQRPQPNISRGTTHEKDHPVDRPQPTPIDRVLTSVNVRNRVFLDGCIPKSSYL